MSLLQDISDSVRQVAEAISIAVGVEVEIVDNELTIVSGTGIYKDRIGEKEEGGDLEGKYLYARVMRSGVTEYLEGMENEEIKRRVAYSPNNEYSGELAEICTPIIKDTDIIGIIGLVAFDKKQLDVLSNKQRNMVSFVEKMADLLAVKAAQQLTLEQVEYSRNEMATLLETAHEGIFAVDNAGYIKQCNRMAASLFKTTKADIVGRHINSFMPSSPALEVIRTGQGYTENEELYKMDKGVFHFIVTVKPFMSHEEIGGVVISFRDISEVQKLVYNINNRTLKNTFDDIIGNSGELKKAKQQALITARGNSTVLITGESGTGKEMFAKAIHYAGERQDKAFVTVNCGAIPENLLESELFGYEKGAFTGASDKGKAGKFEMANGGTIFLDEIGDMPQQLQVKILHVLQNMRFERVGGTKSIIVDVRVIAATNKDLEEMINDGSFREDLYYRLSVIPLTIPPLRERREDIKTLMYYFLKKYNTFMNRNIKGFSREAESVYVDYDWPGNVRELENAVEYGTNMAFGNIIEVDEVPDRLLRNGENIIKFQDTELPLSEQVKRYEREIIKRKLKKYGKGGSGKDAIAKELGLSRATLYRKLTELDIN